MISDASHSPIETMNSQRKGLDVLDIRRTESHLQSFNELKCELPISLRLRGPCIPHYTLPLLSFTLQDTPLLPSSRRGATGANYRGGNNIPYDAFCFRTINSPSDRLLHLDLIPASPLQSPFTPSTPSSRRSHHQTCAEAEDKAADFNWIVTSASRGWDGWTRANDESDAGAPMRGAPSI
jgi:hypothetical protein